MTHRPCSTERCTNQETTHDDQHAVAHCARHPQRTHHLGRGRAPAARVSRGGTGFLDLDRIQEYDFAEGEDFSPVLGKGRGGRPSIDYFLTLDMAKELAMVERSAKGREARRYFIDCECQFRQLQQWLAKIRPAVPVDMTRAERQAVNRQAWAEVSGEVYAAFHARRETVLQTYAEAKSTGPVILPRGYRPPWAR
ncbi:MAG: antA/AntB antirepressor family protein [Thauera sp.]